MRKVVSAMAYVCLLAGSAAQAQQAAVEPNWSEVMSSCLEHSPRSNCELVIGQQQEQWQQVKESEKVAAEAKRALDARLAAADAERKAEEEAMAKQIDERRRQLDLESKRAPYRQAYLASHQPQLLASAHICDMRELLEGAQETMREEREGAKYSGLVDKSVMYKAGQDIRDYTKAISRVTAGLKRTAGKSPLPCTHAAVQGTQWQLNCTAGERDCGVLDFNESLGLVLDWFNGGSNPKEAEAERRPQVDADFAASIARWEQVIASRVAGKNVAVSDGSVAAGQKATTK